MVSDNLVYLVFPWILNPRYLELPLLDDLCINIHFYVSLMHCVTDFELHIFCFDVPLKSRVFLHTSNLELTPVAKANKNRA